jgi:hypothetical protein
VWTENAGLLAARIQRDGGVLDPAGLTVSAISGYSLRVVAMNDDFLLE